MSGRPAEFLTVAYGGISFCTSAACVGALVTGLTILIQPERPSGTFVASNLAMLAYLLFVGAAINAIGFTLVTAVSPAWRRQYPRRAVALGAGFGALAFLFQFSGAIFHIPLLGGIVRLFPRASGFVLFGLPGVVLGCLAVACALFLRSRTTV